MQAEVWVTALTGELHVRAAKEHRLLCTIESILSSFIYMVPEHVLVGQAEMVRVASVIISTQSTLVCQMCVHADCILQLGVQKVSLIQSSRVSAIWRLLN